MVTTGFCRIFATYSHPTLPYLEVNAVSFPGVLEDLANWGLRPSLAPRPGNETISDHNRAVFFGAIDRKRNNPAQDKRYFSGVPVIASSWSQPGSYQYIRHLMVQLTACVGGLQTWNPSCWLSSVALGDCC